MSIDIYSYCPNHLDMCQKNTHFFPRTLRHEANTFWEVCSGKRVICTNTILDANGSNNEKDKKHSAGFNTK